MYNIYEVKNNETISDIANKLNVSVDQLMEINGELSDITQGQLIIVPNKNNYTIYTVSQGDTLYGIAKRNNIDVKSIELFNGLKENEYLYPNQKLKIPKDKIYVTKENDEILKLIKQSKMNYDKFFELNPSLILASDQIIFYDV